MTDREELRYLIDLVMEAARWERSEGECKSALELEISLRLDRLLPAEEEPGDPVLDRVRDWEDSPDTPRGTVRSRQYRNGKVRVTGADGKKHWYPAEQCVRVKCKHSKTGYSWKLREVDDGSEKT